MKLRLVGLGILLILVCAPGVYAQTGTVSGQVVEKNSKTALTRAQVSVNGADIVTTTDPSGRFTLLGIPEGTAKITASYLGLTSQTSEVQVVAGKAVTLDFSLEPSLKTSVNVTAEPILEG